MGAAARPNASRRDPGGGLKAAGPDSVPVLSSRLEALSNPMMLGNERGGRPVDDSEITLAESIE